MNVIGRLPHPVTQYLDVFHSSFFEFFAFFVVKVRGSLVVSLRNRLLQSLQVLQVLSVGDRFVPLQITKAFGPAPFHSFDMSIGVGEVATLTVPVGWHVLPIAGRLPIESKMAVFDYLLVLIQEHEQLGRAED